MENRGQRRRIIKEEEEKKSEHRGRERAHAQTRSGGRPETLAGAAASGIENAGNQTENGGWRASGGIGGNYKENENREGRREEENGEKKKKDLATQRNERDGKQLRPSSRENLEIKI